MPWPKGKPHPKEGREKFGRPSTEANREHMRAVGRRNKGRVHTAESRAHMSAAHLRDEVNYAGIHARVRKIRGRASEKVCSCGQPALHWALLWRNIPRERICVKNDRIFSQNIDDYEAMCGKCASRYDRDPLIDAMKKGEA